MGKKGTGRYYDFLKEKFKMFKEELLIGRFDP